MDKPSMISEDWIEEIRRVKKERVQLLIAAKLLVGAWDANSNNGVVMLNESMMEPLRDAVVLAEHGKELPLG